MNQRQLFLYAFRKSIPVLLGYIFLGAAFGILLVDAGLSWPWAPVMSLLVYAGSMQFALVPLLAAAPPLPTIAAVTLMINSRHLFYGLSFVEMFREMGRKSPYMIFSLTDETYSVLCACRDDAEMALHSHDAAFMIAALHQAYWVIGSTVGALAGALLQFDTAGIDFAMTALFTVILTDQLRSGGRPARISAAIGGGLAVIFLLALGPDAFLLPTLGCTVVALAASDRFFGKGAESHA